MTISPKCSLTVCGVLLPETASELTDLINRYDPFEAPADFSSPDFVLERYNAHWVFEEVSYGEMPEPIKSMLDKLDLSYDWFCEGANGEMPYHFLFDAIRDKSETFLGDEQTLLMPIDFIDRPSYLDHAIKWQQFFKEATMLFVPLSNHQLINFKTDNSVLNAHITRFLRS